MANYDLAFTGPQIDSAIGKVQNAETTVENSTNMIQSAAVFTELNNLATANQVLRSLFIFQSASASGISGSSLSTCPLTQSFSDDASMSVSGSIITLTAGTYIVKADANIGMTNNNYTNTVQGAIVNTGSSDSVLIAGKILQSYNDYSILTTHDFSCIGKLTLSGTTTIALKFRKDSSGGAQVGYSSSISGLGTPIHATVFIEKIA